MSNHAPYAPAPGGAWTPGAPPPAAPPPPPAKDSGTLKKVALGVGGCLGLGLLSSCCLGGFLLWPKSAPDLEVVSAEIVVEPPSPDEPPPAPGRDPHHPQEILRVRYRTEPEATVRLELFSDTADDDGEGTIDYPLNNEHRERTVTASLRAREDYDAPETEMTVTAQREPMLFALNRGFRCNFGGCLITHDTRGRISTTAPEGGSVTVGTSAASPPDITEDLLRAVDPTEAFGTGEFGFTLPLVVRFADGTELRDDYPIPRGTAMTAVMTRLRGARTGPVSVPTEGTGNALLWIPSRARAQLFGVAHRVGDIGRIATDRVDSQRRQCGTYSGSSGVRRLYVRRQHRRIHVYDRRTGRELASHRISARSLRCPRTVEVRPGTGDIFWSETTVTDAAVRAWIEGQAQSGT